MDDKITQPSTEVPIGNLGPGLDEETVDIARMEIFRTGDYGDKGAFGVKDLDEIAASYDPSKHDAPNTIDHAKSGPAYGWVKKVWRDGNVLCASARNVPKSLALALKNGRLEKRSVEIYPPGVVGTTRYLRAVSFLGAQIPHVKGMETIPSLLSESAEFQEFEFSGEQVVVDLPKTNQPGSPDTEFVPTDDAPRDNYSKEEDSLMVEDKKKTAPDEKPGVEDKEKKADAPTDTRIPAAAEFSERIGKLEADGEEKDGRIKALQDKLDASEKARKTEVAVAGFSEVIAAARAGKRMLGVEEEPFKLLFAALPDDEGAEVIEFGEGKDKKSLTPRGILVDLLETRPELAIFGQTVDTAKSIALGQPSGSDPENRRLADAAKKRVDEAATRGETMTFSEALKTESAKAGR